MGHVVGDDIKKLALSRGHGVVFEGLLG